MSFFNELRFLREQLLVDAGELAIEAFYPAFDAECASAGQAIDSRRLMQRVHEASEPRPLMLEAIRRIREYGLSTAAITNNWVSEAEGTHQLRPHFDAFVESCVAGVRKPDPRIYRMACEALGVTPEHAVFLDDIGANLKAARALGMATIKVDDPQIALRALSDLLGGSATNRGEFVLRYASAHGASTAIATLHNRVLAACRTVAKIHALAGWAT